jgi:hypothetical protein
VCLVCVGGGGRRFGHKRPSNAAHFQALRNLLHPVRVVEAANKVCQRGEGEGVSCILVASNMYIVSMS